MQSGIQVTLGFFPLAFLFYFSKPVVVINGYDMLASWGTHFFELQPGKYHVAVYFPYMGRSRCGENSVSVDVHPGCVSRVSYWMPPLIFLRGIMSVS